MASPRSNFVVVALVIILSLDLVLSSTVCPVDMIVPDSYREHFKYAVTVQVDRMFTRTPNNDPGSSSEPVYKNVVVWSASGTGPYPIDQESEFQDGSDTQGNYHYLSIAFNGTDVCLSVNDQFDKTSEDDGSVTYSERCSEQCFKADDYGQKDPMQVYSGTQTINGTMYSEVEVLSIKNEKPNYQRAITCYMDDKVYEGDVQYMNSPIDICPLEHYCLVTAWYKDQGGLPHYTVGCTGSAVDPDTRQCVEEGCAYDVSAGNSSTETYYQRCQLCCSSTMCNDLTKCSGMDCDFYGQKPVTTTTSEKTTPDDISFAMTVTFSGFSFILAFLCAVVNV